jgi:DNA primase
MTDIEAVKQKLDIVEYIGTKVQLKPAGRNYKGRCPFHQEKTPSFMVNPDLQIYKCFGCGEGGDVLTFIAKTEGVEFGEALRIAADHVGYKLENNQRKDDGQDKLRNELYKINQLATDYWHYVLNTHAAGKEGRDYIAKRAIRKQEIDLFKLGYAPQGANLVNFLRTKGYTNDQLVQWGLAVERNGEIIDKFRGRLMLPIFNLRGQVVGFSGRVTYQSDYAPKYLNSSETPVYKKSEILMGIYQAKDAARLAKTLILEEGNLDLMASHKVGIGYICATGGTAITQQQMKLVKRYAERVLFCFDTDAAGQKALLKAISYAEELGMEHGVIELGTHKDPDDLIQHEPELWQERVQNPTNSYDYLFRTLAVGLDLGSATGKSRYAKLLVPILRLIKDPVQLSHFSGELAVAVQVTQDVILQQIAQSTGELPLMQEIAAHHQHTTEEFPVQPESYATSREDYFLSLIAAVPAAEMPDLHTSQEMLSDPRHRQVFAALIEQTETGMDFSKLADSLPADAQSTLQTALSWDLSDLETSLAVELSHIDALIYESWLRREILTLRTKLSQNPDDEASLHNLLALSNELQSLTKQSSSI